MENFTFKLTQYIIIGLFIIVALSAHADFDVPPFANAMLEKEGVSVEDLKNDPELRKKWLVRFQQMGSKMENPKPSKRQNVKSVGTKRTDSSKQDFYRVIVENNLFRPLGYRKRKPGPAFELVATIVDSKTGGSRAFIRNNQNQQTYYVGVGETFAGATVEKIETLKVTLKQNGKPQEIRIAEGGFLSGGGENRGGPGRSRAGGRRPPEQPQPNQKANVKSQKNPKKIPDAKAREEMMRKLKEQEMRKLKEQGEKRGR